MPDLIADNPAALVGAARAIVLALIGLFAAFGLPITKEQKDAILALTEVIVPVSIVFTYLTHRLTVPKSPSPDPQPKSIQQLPQEVTVTTTVTPPPTTTPGGNP